jgi:diadenosine tetraphosphatase ApaH/serine/threonine PP2A family protein phosphatase
MIIALLSDMHGNREALSACLADARNHEIDRYVFLGDYVGYGADPGWVVDTVMAHVDRGAVAIVGNHDAAIHDPDFNMNVVAEIAIEWTRHQLDAAQREFLASLPLRVEEEDRLYVHANAWAPDRWGYITNARDARRSFDAGRRRLTFCGHIHVPQLYGFDQSGEVSVVRMGPGTAIPLAPASRWLAVLGSVGQPRDGNPAAFYAVYDTERGAFTARRVAYDIESAAGKIHAAGLPPVLGRRLQQGR